MRKTGTLPLQILCDPPHQTLDHSLHATTRLPTITRCVRRSGKETVRTERGIGTETERGSVSGNGNVTGTGTETERGTVSGNGTETATTEETTGTEMTVDRLKIAGEKCGTVTESGTVTGTAVATMTELILFTRKRKKNVWRGWGTGRSM